MGWLFTQGLSKKDLIQHLTVTNVGDHVKTIARCIRGNTLWTVHEYTNPGDRWIGCYLLGAEKGFGWGSKNMDESMGPSEVNCPLSYLDMVPNPPNQWAVEWRAKVRAFHARREVTKGVKPGQLLILLNGCTPNQLVAVEPRTCTKKGSRSLYGRDPNTGMVWRVQREHVVQVRDVEMAVVL